MPRKNKGPAVTAGVEHLRTMQELPQVLHFIVTNKDKFGFPTLDVEILEESFTETNDFLIADLFARLLRHVLQKKETRKEIRICSFVKHLQELLIERGASFNPLANNTEFDKLTPADKLKLLKWMADQTKERQSDERDFMDDFDNNANDSTVINAGQDSENRTYWYFDDLRLYRASAHNRDWHCVAITTQDWDALLKQFKKSPEEQELYTFLNEHLYPPIRNLIERGAARPKKPTDDELVKREETDIEKMVKQDSDTAVDPTAQIKSENPELSRVLSEEPSNAKDISSENIKTDIKGDFKVNSCGQQATGKALQESPFSHQQNQVFVFSTSMANRAADAVMSGQSKSIISYHMEDPETKKFLQKHPLRVSSHLMHGGGPHQQMPPTRPGFNNMNGGPHWPAGTNSNIPLNQQQPHPGWNGMRPMGPNHYQPRPESPYGLHPGMHNRGPDISHNIVPDENLTPEQLQKREDGLASLRKIHQMLLAEDYPGSMQPPTDFIHINMAQDRQGSSMSNEEYAIYGPPGMPPMEYPPHMGPGGGMPSGPIPPGGMPPGSPHMVDPAMNHAMMHQKPPPPYPAAVSMPSPAPAKTKKRKASVQSPAAPQSPLSQSMKSPKYIIPPSPLAQQGNGSMTPQALPPGAMPGFPLPGSFPQDMPPHSGTPPQCFPGSTGINSQASTGGNLMQAGPPEPFQGHPAVSAPGQKPPPSYSQSTKRGGGVESMTTPPTQIHYYSQFENQELTITKQRNSSYQESTSLPPTGEIPTGQQQQMVSRAPGGPPSNRSMNPASPLISRSSSMTNITSASIANLARGVEQNLSQMQQTMMQGGPFKDIQQQQQPGQQGAPPMIGSNGPSSQAPPLHSQNGAAPGGPVPPSSMTSAAHHSVNNTYVNAHMSIGQVNIQNVNASQQHASFDANGRPTHMQQNVDVSMNTGVIAAAPQRFSEDVSAGTRPTGPAVKVQNKGAGTIQYLPVSQPALPSINDSPMLPQKVGLDYLPERFPPPLTNLENKAPTSKLNYFPDNSRLPPPAPQRLPFSSSPMSVSSCGPPMTSQGMFPHGLPHPGMYPNMQHGPMPPHMSQPGVPHGPPSHGPQMMMGHHPPPPSMSYGGGPPSHGAPHTPTMMEPVNSPHMHGHPMMMQQQGGAPPPPHMMGPHSPYGHPSGPPDFGPPMSAGGYPGDMMPGGPPRGQHPHPGGPPPQHMHQHMMMPQQGGHYMGGPAPGHPYMMGQ